ncbi:MAG: hypothetical protein JWM80_5829 [Cyanobacteria bacterium RYN_339]|nr:hypothetical protein [Cyanobacteria bacterium RYN_339]
MSHTAVRSRLVLMVSAGFAEDLYKAAGPSGDVGRLVGFCLALHRDTEPGPVFHARVACATHARGLRERLELWLPAAVAEALVARATAARLTPAQYLAGLVGSVAYRLANAA